jgi:hypothetical protein
MCVFFDVDSLTVCIEDGCRLDRHPEVGLEAVDSGDSGLFFFAGFDENIEDTFERRALLEDRFLWTEPLRYCRLLGVKLRLESAIDTPE